MSRHLSLALIITLMAHFLVIVLVRFDVSRPSRALISTTLEVILVRPRAPVMVKNPDYLAPINQQGSGPTEEVVRPADPPADPIPATILVPALPAPIALVPKSRPRVMTTVPKLTPSLRPAEATVKEPILPSAVELIASSHEIVQHAPEILPNLQSTTQRPRSKYISANTREYKYAAYMEAWRMKVERIGNLNYPLDAQRHGIYGSLILDVSLDANGGVRDITVVRTSGHKLLDDTAIYIVKLSAPFAALPSNIRQDTDILHITRTWQFREGNLSSRR